MTTEHFDNQIFEADVIEAIRFVHDPEIPINVYDLGLIYHIDIDGAGNVQVAMTLTTPNCPEAQTIPGQVRLAIKRNVPAVQDVQVNLVWDPPWTRDMMSEDARLALGFGD
jgi:FeS assembly SUF system protein